MAALQSECAYTLNLLSELIDLLSSPPAPDANARVHTLLNAMCVLPASFFAGPPLCCSLLLTLRFAPPLTHRLPASMVCATLTTRAPKPQAL